MRFADKSVVVTGGSSGIGLAAAQAFIAEGARVLICAREAARLARALAQLGPGASGVLADVSEPTQVARVMQAAGERFGQIDVLFANAGTAAMLPIAQVTEAVWHQVVDANLKGVFFCVQQALPLMPRGSAIVLNASLAAHRSLPGMAVYAASKAGVVALARALAIELLQHGVRINAICPGPIATAITEHTQGIDAAGRASISATPMGRAGTSAEAAAAVLYLASSEAAFVTGTELVLDGGIAAS